MKELTIYFLLITLFSCNQQNTALEKIKTESIYEQINQLGERYFKLGRFSGTILIANETEIIFNENFGYSKHLDKIPFTNNSTFKIGSLSSVYFQQILNAILIENKIDTNSLLANYFKDYAENIKLKDLIENNILSQKLEYKNAIESLLVDLSDDSIGNIFKKYCTKWNLKNTYLKSIRNSESIGHLYLNNGNGLEWDESPTIDPDSVSIFGGIKSNPEDFYTFLKENSIQNLNIDGYLKEDGFSYSVLKDKNKTIIIFSNTRHPVGKEMTESIDAILNYKEYNLPLKRIEISIDRIALNKFQGEYILNPNMNLKIELVNDSLFTYMGPNKIYLAPQSANQFFMKQTDAAIKFIKDEKNIVTGAIMLDGFLSGNFIEKQIEK